MVSKIAKNSIQIYSLAPILKNPIFLLLISNLRSFLSNARPPGKIPIEGRSGWGRWMPNGGLGGSLFVGALMLEADAPGEPDGNFGIAFCVFFAPGFSNAKSTKRSKKDGQFFGDVSRACGDDLPRNVP